VGLLGDRYGWVPPADRMQAAAQEAGFDADLAGKSVTELEILYGVLDSPDQRRRSWFYFREELPYDQMPADVAAQYSDARRVDPQAQQYAARLDALKARIRQALPDRVRAYEAQWDAGRNAVTGLEAWGRQVLEDLWSDLERETEEFLREAPRTWQAQELRALEEFVEGRAQGFVGRAAVTRELMSLATSPARKDVTQGRPWGVCVTAPAGAGKSALFAHLYRALQQREHVLVLAHAAGTSIRSTQVGAMLRRWVYALARELGIDDPLEDLAKRLEETALAPVTGTSRGYYLWVGFLLMVIAWGVYAYSRQLQDGLIVTGMRDRISWGLYITTFVFFIGISHAGTLISAILRVSQARWRTPVTRMAEFITVVALICGALFVIIDLGRPDRLLNVFIYGRWQSPIIWDVLAITTYLTASVTYLFLPMIPDLALFRDRLTGRVSAWRSWLYRVLAIGWRGNASQWRSLGAAMAVMMILIIPIAVSVHTVVSWIFAMTLRVPWNSTIFGAFFVAGAIFSGIAMLIIVMAILRKVYHLEEYITEKHFVYLGYMLGAFSLIMIYGNISEFLVTGYKLEEGEEFHFRQLFLGQFAGLYWFYFLGGLVIPGLLILLPWTRNIWGVVTASVLVVTAMWVERYFIVVA
ncbi:hypothetical protein LCGC14_2173020, partial [marine sediment metagenome]